MSYPYIPGINDDILLETKDVYLPDNKLIYLINLIYDLDKKYHLEKIVSFNDADYLKEIQEITGNKTLELSNHFIEDKLGYFHLTFEKKLDPNLKINYDKFCPYAFSIILDDKLISRSKYYAKLNQSLKAS